MRIESGEPHDLGDAKRITVWLHMEELVVAAAHFFMNGEMEFFQHKTETSEYSISRPQRPFLTRLVAVKPKLPPNTANVPQILSTRPKPEVIKTGAPEDDPSTVAGAKEDK